MKGKIAIFQIIQIAVFFLSLFTDWYGPLTVVLFVSVIVMMLDTLGKGIVLREIIALHSCFVCLLMPLVGYTFFPRTNAIARIWVRYMPIPLEQYFSFCLPAVAGFVLALCWPLMNQKYTDHGPALQARLEKARGIVQQKANIGLLLLVIGMLSFEGSNYLPAAVQFFFLLFYFAGFAGLLYVYYAKSFKYRKVVLFGFAIFILITTLNTGMFTIVAYMGMTLLSFFFLGQKTKLWKKLMFFAVAVFFLMVVQMVKPAFRAKIWKGDYQGNRALLFGNLFMDKLTNLNVESADVFFPVYYRTNQGFNVSLVMRRIPASQPHDNGSNLALALASAFVPRFLWPDKPEAGGKFNMAYYTGIKIVGWSTNIGPLGEAWGSFGTAGILFMVLLGLFIRFAYRTIFKISVKIPLLMFWLPVFFYQVTYSAETDTLQIFNFLVKASFFVFLLYKVKPDWFILVKKKKRRPTFAEPLIPNDRPLESPLSS